MAVNTPIQGTAADLIKLAMINIQKRLARENLGSKMILQVHDELVFEVPDEEIDKMKTLGERRNGRSAHAFGPDQGGYGRGQELG